MLGLWAGVLPGLQEVFKSLQVVLVISQNWIRALAISSPNTRTSVFSSHLPLCMHTGNFLEPFSWMVNRTLTPRASLLHPLYPGQILGPAGILDLTDLSSLSRQAIVLMAPGMVSELQQPPSYRFWDWSIICGHQWKLIKLQTWGPGCKFRA